MVFSNKRNWRKSLQCFSKSRDFWFLKYLFEIFNRTNSIADEFSFFFYHSMKDNWCWNGNLRSCYLLWWYLFRCWSYRLRIFLSNVSCWVSVSNWFKYCSISLRSSSSFQIIWFVALILLWCCNRKQFFWGWVCSDEKTSGSCFFRSTDEFWIFPASISEKKQFVFCSGFTCVFSVGFVFGSTDVSSSSYTVIFTVWVL